MALDNVEISNSALTIIGSVKIVAMNDPSPEARECNSNYDSCRRAVLRDFPWNFATARVVLSTPDATPPAFGFANRFALPDDFIRVHTAFDESGCQMLPNSYRIESGFLITDEDTIWLKYVYDLEDTAEFDPLFDQALAANLAAKIAFKITGSESTRESAQKVYMDELSRAKYTDSVEEATTILEADEWISARNGSGDFVRDPMT